MQEKIFTIKTIENAQKIVEVARNTTYEIDLIRGRYVVDLRSILGVLSVDISQPATIRLHTNNENEGNSFFDVVSEILNQ